MSDGSKKQIKDIAVGEYVLSAEGNSQRVTKKFVHEDNQALFSINQGPFFITSGHPFMTKNGWKSISPKATERDDYEVASQTTRLSKNDVVLSEQGEVKITSIVKKNSTEMVYNIEVANDHTYRANGFFVHNK